MIELLSSFLNILILVGAIQGFIIFVLLQRLASHKAANKLLSWIILLISLACFNIYLLEAVELTSTFWVILGSIFPLVIIMPIGPLVYFYVKSILYSDFQFTKKYRPHFYTISIDLLPYFLLTILVLGSFIGFFNSSSSKTINDFVYYYNKYVDIPRWISLSIYLLITYRMMRHYQGKNYLFFSWAKQFTLGFLIFAVIWLLHLIPYVIPALSDKLLGSVGWYPVYMPLIILIYWLGINGIMISFNSYKKVRQSNLSAEQIQKTKKALVDAMEKDRLFLNPSLKLNDIINHTGISQKIVSEVLNQHIGKSFNEYINSYRVEEFKLRLLNSNTSNLTITGIAFECGFNSQATFQRTFKSLTNLSPKEFQQKHQK